MVVICRWVGTVKDDMHRVRDRTKGHSYSFCVSASILSSQPACVKVPRHEKIQGRSMGYDAMLGRIEFDSRAKVVYAAAAATAHALANAVWRNGVI